MKARACVLGHFGEGLNLLNGQTVKTKIVTEELQRQLGRDQVIKIDTHGGWKTLLKAPFQVFKALRKSQNVLIFPAHNGLRVYAPLLSFQRRFFKKRKIHYVVIGGWLPKFLMQRKKLSKVLKNFDAIYVETTTMKRALEEQGFSNIYVMPNCKKLNILSENELVYPSGIPYKLCTFSRVMKEKGIEDAVNVIKTINTELGYQAFSLDIYGQVDSDQTEWFENLKSTFPDYINYGGTVPFDKSIEILKNYYALLFPTHYQGEGFAGTLIDAFFSGVPVIASDWNYNSEIITDNIGFMYPAENKEAFVNILRNIVADPKLVLNKKKNCLKEAEKYRIENAVRILLQQL